MCLMCIYRNFLNVFYLNNRSLGTVDCESKWSSVHCDANEYAMLVLVGAIWCYLVRHKQCRWESWHWTEVVALMLHKCSGIFPLRQVFSNRIIPIAVEHYAAIYYINSRDACHSLLNGISVVLIAFRIKYHASYSVFIAICVW